MRLFLSCAGKKTYALAELFKDWIQEVIQGITPPFVSSQSIEDGKRWGLELAKELEVSNTGIIFLTKESIGAPWIFFEAGAMSKKFKSSRVYTLIFEDINLSDVPSPLTQFQNTVYNRDRAWKLVKELNKYFGKIKVEKNLQIRFDSTWDKFNKSVQLILKKPTGKSIIYQHIDRLIASENCNNNELKRWVIDEITLQSALHRIEGISGNRMTLNAYPPRDYAAVIFQSFIEKLKPGDNYYAISTMGFFSKNKIEGGVRYYFSHNIKAIRKGANIYRVILAHNRKIEKRKKEDHYKLLKNEIEHFKSSLINPKGKYVISVKVLRDQNEYNEVINDVKGFGLIERKGNYILIIPEDLKGKKPKVQIYFSNGKDQNMKIISKSLNDYHKLMDVV